MYLSVPNSYLLFLGLQNDHTALLKQIEEGLVAVHSQARTAEADPNGVNVPPPQPNFEPFAKVDHVTLGSPAHIAVRVRDFGKSLRRKKRRDFREDF